jgi:hypothetical protein
MGSNLATQPSLIPGSVVKLPKNATCKVTKTDSKTQEQTITCTGSDKSTVVVTTKGETTKIVNKGLEAKAALGQAQVTAPQGTIPLDTVDPNTRSGQGTGTAKATEPPQPVADKIDSKNVVTEVQKADAQFQQLPDLKKQLAAETDPTKKKELQAQIDLINQNKDKILSATQDPAKGAALLNENGGQTGLKAYLMLDYADNKQTGFGYQVIKKMIGTQTSASPNGDSIQYDSGLEAYKDPARFKNTTGMGWRIQSDVEAQLEAKALAELQERVNMLNNLGNYAVSGNPNDKNIEQGSWGKDVGQQEVGAWMASINDPQKAKEWYFANKFYADQQFGKGDNDDPAQYRNELYTMGSTEMEALNIDKNHDRRLDAQEWTDYFKPYSENTAAAQSEAQRWMTALDANKDDTIDVVEYTAGNTFLGDSMASNLKVVAANQDAVTQLAAERGISASDMQARLDSLLSIAAKSDLTNANGPDYILTPEERQFLGKMVEIDPELVRSVQSAFVNGYDFAGQPIGAWDMNKAYYRYQDDAIRTQNSAMAAGFERPYADVQHFDFTAPAANTTLADIHKPVENDPLGRTTGDMNGFVVDVDQWKDYAAGQPNSGSISNIYWYLKNEMGWTDLPWETFRQQFVELNNIQDPKQWLYYPGQQVYLGDLLTTQFETSAGVPATP